MLIMDYWDIHCCSMSFLAMHTTGLFGPALHADLKAYIEVVLSTIIVHQS